MRWAGRGAHHLHDQTTYPDTLLDDETEPEENKRVFRQLLSETRILFKEMATISEECRQRAEDLKAGSRFCTACRWCCKLPDKRPALLQWLEKKYTEFNDGNPWVGVWFAVATDLYYIVGALTRGPWYIFYLTSRIIKAGMGDKRRVCSEVVDLLKHLCKADEADEAVDGASLPVASTEEAAEEEADQDLAAWMKTSLHQFEAMRQDEVKADLPEPGDKDFDD
eukprot:TRINITY_DN12272_c0_g1_i2.p2 TRINITY_DN12272_c0_g1~~TRINITY_DN12272_c0_g1_i2.p2  ORF type:complete len:223 (+),score=42.54 TRINITY_DN12272_c0_g1_i2:1037-1705(+)